MAIEKHLVIFNRGQLTRPVPELAPNASFSDIVASRLTTDTNPIEMKLFIAVLLFDQHDFLWDGNNRTRKGIFREIKHKYQVLFKIFWNATFISYLNLK